MISSDLLIIKAANFIKELEGFKPIAYQDTGGKWSYGIGFTRTPNGTRVKEGDYINEANALVFLRKIITSDLQKIKQLIKVPLGSYQWQALLSFVYNIGVTRFTTSTILKKINNSSGKEEISKEFKKWIYDNGQVVKGLQDRRNKEINLYFTEDIASLNL